MYKNYNLEKKLIIQLKKFIKKNFVKNLSSKKKNLNKLTKKKKFKPLSTNSLYEHLNTGNSELFLQNCQLKDEIYIFVHCFA